MLNNLEWSIRMTQGMVWYQNLFGVHCLQSCRHKECGKEMKKICTGPVRASDKEYQSTPVLVHEELCLQP